MNPFCYLCFYYAIIYTAHSWNLDRVESRCTESTGHTRKVQVQTYLCSNRFCLSGFSNLVGQWGTSSFDWYYWLWVSFEFWRKFSWKFLLRCLSNFSGYFKCFGAKGWSVSGSLKFLPALARLPDIHDDIIRINDMMFDMRCRSVAGMVRKYLGNHMWRYGVFIYTCTISDWHENVTVGWSLWTRWWSIGTPVKLVTLRTAPMGRSPNGTLDPSRLVIIPHSCEI